jgi:hypothetical protein
VEQGPVKPQPDAAEDKPEPAWQDWSQLKDQVKGAAGADESLHDEL